jgi:hypothetical protein
MRRSLQFALACPLLYYENLYCQVFLCYSISDMGFLAWLRKVQHALHECAESIRRTEQRKRNQEMPRNEPVEVRAIVSFDKQTIADTTAQNERNYAAQKSIKNATWAAFYAVAAYAVVTTFMWYAMMQQNKIATIALHQSTDTFRTDERAWVEIEPIQGSLFSPKTKEIGAGFRYPIYLKNVGKTVARNIQFRALRNGSQSSIKMGDDAQAISWEQDKLLLGQVQTAANIPTSNPIPKVLAPQTTLPIPVILSGQEPQVFKNDEWVSYLIGRIDYTDAFGVSHWIKFCFFVVNYRGELWHCKEGNDEDINPETPPKRD